MAELNTNEVVQTKAVKRKISETEDLAGGSPKIAKTEPTPEKAEKVEKAEKKPTPFDTKKIIAKYYRIKVQEIVGELLNPLKEDFFDAPATLKKLEYYVVMAKEKAKKAGIPCCLELKSHLW